MKIEFTRADGGGTFRLPDMHRVILRGIRGIKINHGFFCPAPEAVEGQRCHCSKYGQEQKTGCQERFSSSLPGFGKTVVIHPGHWLVLTLFKP
jgi:hypothetical protein